MDSINEDPFSVFVASTEIRYCYYAETEKILGNTFGMCVLQVSFIMTFQIDGTAFKDIMFSYFLEFF